MTIEQALKALPVGWRLTCLRQAAAGSGESGWFARAVTDDYETVTWGKGENWITDHIAGHAADAWADTPAEAVRIMVQCALGAQRIAAQGMALCENSRSEVEAEARQPGGEAMRPDKPTPTQEHQQP